MRRYHSSRVAARLFEGRDAIITGASDGIGRDVGLRFAEQGANVALFARRWHMIEELADEISATGGTALPVKCDVTDVEQVGHSVMLAEKEFGTLDILVNNAGCAIPSRFQEARIEDLRRMMEVNYFGAVHVTHAVLPIMQRSGFGNIVNVASIAGRRGGATLSGYSASKFALIGLNEALRSELFGSGIVASLVVPAAVDTVMLDNREWQAREWMIGNLKMPPSWVTAGIIAAVVLGLAEVEVPPGIVTAEKIAALFPDLSAAFFGLGSRAIDVISEWLNPIR